MAIATQLSGKRRREVYYPTGDGKPMGETTLHRDQMFYCIAALQARFIDRPDVYISGNDFIYYEEGNPVKRVSPDCYVVFGVGNRQRDFYKCWEEGKPPDVVFEITSKKTKKEDQNQKLPLYEQILKVPEYFQFDPTGDYLKPRLQGHRLVEGHYQLLLPIDGRLHSELLNLDLVVEGNMLRLVDPVTGEKFLTALEMCRRLEQETRRADTEKERANITTFRLEQETRRADEEAQRADIEKERADITTRQADTALHYVEVAKEVAQIERERADIEARWAQLETRRADAAERRADALEAEVARLRAEKEASRREPDETE